MIEQGGAGNTSPLQVSINPFTIFGNGKALVASAGAPQALAGSTSTGSITVKALVTNTGQIYVGNSSMTKATGFELSASESVSMDINNLNKIYIDADNTGEGVTYIYVD